MKFSLTLFLLLFGFYAKSQPVLNSTELAPFGSSYNYKGLSTFSAIDTSLQGANQIWDFSSLVPDANPVSSRTIFNPIQTIYADSFPTANYGILHLPTATYEFFRLDTERMEALGSYTASHAYSYYTNSETRSVFPLSMGVSNTDTSMLSTNIQNDLYNFNCIGWGTLLVPGHTYTNVLMMHIIFYNHTGINNERYEWIDAGNGMTVFSYTVPVVPSIAESAYYLYNISSYSGQLDMGTSIRINNPFHSTLQILFNSETDEIFSFDVFNLSGKIICSGQIPNKTTASFCVDLENEANGMYTLIIYDTKNLARRHTFQLIKH